MMSILDFIVEKYYYNRIKKKNECYDSILYYQVTVPNIKVISIKKGRSNLIFSCESQSYLRSD